MDDQPPIDAFAVWAEAEGQARPLLMIGLTLARLFDDIVVPYQTGEPFFVDGVPVKGKELKRIKILRAMPGLSNSLALFNRTLHSGDPKLQQIYGDQYHTRLEAILRQRTEDVTGQIIKAYDRAIKPSIKDYLPRREELIGMAAKVFVEAMKSLGGA